MNVKDLIAALGQMPADAQVVYHDHRTLTGIISARVITDGPLRNTVELATSPTRIVDAPQ